ncbi:MAG: PAS domain S-box protein [Acidobacteriota bacterium]
MSSDECGRLADILREQQALTEAILDSAADAIITIDPHGTIVAFNNAACRLFGYAYYEIIGESVATLMPAPHADRHGDYLARYQATGDPHIIGRTIEVEPRRKDGSTFPAEMHVSEVNLGTHRLFTAFLRDITTRKDTERRVHLLVAALEQADEMIMITDIAGRIQYVNTAFEQVTGWTRKEIVGANPRVLRSGNQTRGFYENLWNKITKGQRWTGIFANRTKTGDLYLDETSISAVRDETGNITHFVAIKEDVTTRESNERQLRHSQKMQSVGQLAAGIAHEINTPTQYIGDNTRFLDDACHDLFPLFDALGAIAAARTTDDLPADFVSVVKSAMEKADLDFLREEIPKAIGQSLEGIARVTKIVRAMKDFSHLSTDKQPADLNRNIENTLTVATNEWKYVADVVKKLDPDLPLVPCLADEFNQVILNLVVNATHAIADVLDGSGQEKGTITVETGICDDFAQVKISDTGSGMPDDVREHIFDPFFTTKEIGKGTGQGLSIAHDVIVEKHGGSIEVESEVGKGTCFTLSLPLHPAEEDTTSGTSGESS